ncbi:MAG: IS91 family transposase [Planctomycetes bacterium]|nr:IS91 family transposase [Planctomycetota bacterium]
MHGPALEVADIFRQHARPYLTRHGASPQQRRVIRDIQACRTAALGGHVQQCDRCGHQTISYNSCRNRHCPKCQGPARARWLDARSGELLPVPYFHVVFTLPGVLAPVALQNPAVVYDLLFRSVAATLLEVAANPRRLGARIGFLAVLHTWGQNLMHHPHIHCVVPAGGLSPDGTNWVPGHADFFLPVRVLSRVFRGKFIGGLKAAFDAGTLRFHGRLRPLAAAAAMERLLDRSVTHEWVVYAKPPFGGPAQVLKYLARYTHRVAISNHRLLGLEDGKVTFRWKDYARGNRPGVMTLDAGEFIRRFLMHVMPRGFVRIRSYGFMANRRRAEHLRWCRQLLDRGKVPPTQNHSQTDRSAEPGEDIAPCCPSCQEGRMHLIGRLERQRPPCVRAWDGGSFVGRDTS